MGTSTGDGGPNRRLAPHPASVGEARRFVRLVLERAGRLDLLDTAELLVSEIVTNALVHAGTSVEVTARADAGKLRVEVGDGSHSMPAVRHHASLAGTGRGLKLLHRLAVRWGADMHLEGKTVWFELESADFERALTDPDPSSGVGVQLPDDRPGTVAVELLNLPLLLHAAWQEHAEALLREFLLSKIDDEDGFGELQAHAAASEAIALLLEHLPEIGLGDDAEELMTVVSEPHVSRERTVVPVPADAVGNFRVLDETLAEASVLADAGGFLTAPTQPEIRGFRQWVCGQVERQGAGDGPTPWADLSGAAPPRARAELDWETAEVSGSPRGLIGADDTDRIIAISEPALALLGYDAPEQLVGQRLIAIIPPRFRQAHLSGFTRFFSTGRAPLLTGPVRVPALCRDGSETMLELAVRAHLLPSGRHVFVGEFWPTS